MTRPEIVLRLPVPPSVNNLFWNVRGRGRVRTRAYRAWQTEVGWLLKAQRRGCVGGPWECHIELPASTRADADNLAKPLLDALVKSGVVADDKFCRRLTIEKTGKRDLMVAVTVRAAT